MTEDLDLMRAFDRSMAGIYDDAKAAGYNATRFLVMVRQHGGLETAHRLLASADVSYGFTELWILGRQDLTVEALVLKPEFESLFTPAELRTARDRLGTLAPSAAPSAEMIQEPREPTWTPETFLAAAVKAGPVVSALVSKFFDWVSGQPGAMRLGEGTTGPLYFAPRSLGGGQVAVVSISLNGSLEVLMNDLALNPPFDKLASRIELQGRLNGILGFSIRDEVIETATWQTVDGAYLLSPGAFAQLRRIYEWVARELGAGEMRAQ